MSIKTYSELITIATFEERYSYLRLDGSVGKETFGFDRFLNQAFYTSKEWKRVRDYVIVRDGGCDLGIEDRIICGKIYIHHINPIRPIDLKEKSEYLLDPEFLITVSHQTHNAIHFGDVNQIAKDPIERTKNDTCPWRH